MIQPSGLAAATLPCVALAPCSLQFPDPHENHNQLRIPDEAFNSGGAVFGGSGGGSMNMCRE